MKLAMRAHKVSRDKSLSDAHYVGWPTDDTRHVLFCRYDLQSLTISHLDLPPRQIAQAPAVFVHQRFCSSAPAKLQVIT
jgi:hypothetical protein